MTATAHSRSGGILEDSNVLIKSRQLESPPGENRLPSQRGNGTVAPEQTQPAPTSSVSQFLKEALSSQKALASAASPFRMDLQRYWEKRRVQNLLRRVLEAIQERFFGVEGDVASADLGAVFDLLVSSAAAAGGIVRGGSGRAAADGDRLGAKALSDGFHELGLWPVELTDSDKNEVLGAMYVPCAAAARAVLEGQPQRQTLQRRTFCEGFDRVPFNIPDFPVPMHLLSLALPPNMEKFTLEQVQAVAEVTASTFANDKTGAGRVKDPFICGLLSLEEIQAALPQLMPKRLIEEAVARIIVVGAPLFTNEEWYDLVINVRTREACGHDKEDAPTTTESAPAGLPLGAPSSGHVGHGGGASSARGPLRAGEADAVTLASPSPRHREVPVDGPATMEMQGLTGETPAAKSAPSEGFPTTCHASGSEAEASSARVRGRYEPVTEPLPCRELGNEDPVHFSHQERLPPQESRATPAVTVVNWGTAARAARASSTGAGGGAEGGHQADEGAGTRLSWGTRAFKQELQQAQRKAASGSPGRGGGDGSANLLAWVNLEQHNECGGPYLARAFVRCCQLYERRPSGRRNSMPGR